MIEYHVFPISLGESFAQPQKPLQWIDKKHIIGESILQIDFLWPCLPG